eukprot:Clim_evm14s183 gene=Clim_evmTU14s183
MNGVPGGVPVRLYPNVPLPLGTGVAIDYSVDPNRDLNEVAMEMYRLVYGEMGPATDFMLPPKLYTSQGQEIDNLHYCMPNSVIIVTRGNGEYFKPQRPASTKSIFASGAEMRNQDPALMSLLAPPASARAGYANVSAHLEDLMNTLGDASPSADGSAGPVDNEMFHKPFAQGGGNGSMNGGAGGAAGGEGQQQDYLGEADDLALLWENLDLPEFDVDRGRALHPGHMHGAGGMDTSGAGGPMKGLKAQMQGASPRGAGNMGESTSDVMMADSDAGASKSKRFHPFSRVPNFLRKAGSKSPESETADSKSKLKNSPSDETSSRKSTGVIKKNTKRGKDGEELDQATIEFNRNEAHKAAEARSRHRLKEAFNELQAVLPELDTKGPPSKAQMVTAAAALITELRKELEETKAKLQHVQMQQKGMRTGPPGSKTASNLVPHRPGSVVRAEERLDSFKRRDPLLKSIGKEEAEGLVATAVIELTYDENSEIPSSTRIGYVDQMWTTVFCVPAAELIGKPASAMVASYRIPRDAVILINQAMEKVISNGEVYTGIHVAKSPDGQAFVFERKVRASSVGQNRILVSHAYGFTLLSGARVQQVFNEMIRRAVKTVTKYNAEPCVDISKLTIS